MQPKIARWPIQTHYKSFPKSRKPLWFYIRSYFCAVLSVSFLLQAVLETNLEITYISRKFKYWPDRNGDGHLHHGPCRAAFCILCRAKQAALTHGRLHTASAGGEQPLKANHAAGKANREISCVQRIGIMT